MLHRGHHSRRPTLPNAGCMAPQHSRVGSYEAGWAWQGRTRVARLAPLDEAVRHLALGEGRQAGHRPAIVGNECQQP